MTANDHGTRATHKSSLMVRTPMPRLSDDHSISTPFRKLSLAKIVKPAIDTPNINTSERTPRQARYAFIPRLAHPLARLDTNQRLEVETRIVGRGRVKQQTTENARSSSGLDDDRTRGLDSFVDERQC